jgi:conserved domain protein
LQFYVELAPALEYFADYIDGKVEFVKLAAKIWE